MNSRAITAPAVPGGFDATQMHPAPENEGSEANLLPSPKGEDEDAEGRTHSSPSSSSSFSIQAAMRGCDGSSLPLGPCTCDVHNFSVALSWGERGNYGFNHP